MVTRILSSLVLLPILVTLILIGGIPFKISILIMSNIGLYEYYNAIFGKIKPIHYYGFIASTTYMLILDTPFSYATEFVLALFVVIPLISTVSHHKSIDITDIALTFFGVFYVTVMFSMVYLIRCFEYGIFTIWIPFICAWGCDTGAYFVGITLGKHKLTPELSPKKTIEGSIGGVVVASAVCGIHGFLIAPHIENISASLNNEIVHIFDNRIYLILSFMVVGAIGAVFAQFGDLTASAIKRKYDIKDFGNLIPGHGGVLDRFDSIIFTSCICYVMLKIIELM